MARTKENIVFTSLNAATATFEHQITGVLERTDSLINDITAHIVETLAPTGNGDGTLTKREIDQAVNFLPKLCGYGTAEFLAVCPPGSTDHRTAREDIEQWVKPFVRDYIQRKMQDVLLDAIWKIRSDDTT